MLVKQRLLKIESKTDRINIGGRQVMRKPFAISFPKGNLINLDDMHEHRQFMGLSTKGIWPMHMTYPYSGFIFVVVRRLLFCLLADLEASISISRRMSSSLHCEHLLAHQLAFSGRAPVQAQATSLTDSSSSPLSCLVGWIFRATILLPPC